MTLLCSSTILFQPETVAPKEGRDGWLVKCDVIILGLQDVTICDKGREGIGCTYLLNGP